MGNVSGGGGGGGLLNACEHLGGAFGCCHLELRRKVGLHCKEKENRT